MTDRNDDSRNSAAFTPPDPNDTVTAEHESGQAPAGDVPPPADATVVVPSPGAVPPPLPAPNDGPQLPPQPPPPPPPPPSGPPAYPPQATPPQAYTQPTAPPQYGHQPHPPHASGQPVGHTAFAAPQYGQLPGTPVPTSSRRSGGAIVGALIMLGAAILSVIGSALPWVTFDNLGFSELPNGFETYGFYDEFDPVQWTNPGAWIIGAFAVVAILAIVVLAAGKSTWSSICGIIASLVAGTIAAAAVVGIADLTNTFPLLQVGPGIILIIGAALMAFVGSLIVAIAS
ncbi:hypothetical protein [Ilumatobacter nonamiensis]|uniref:hypothetical protein n=1 Tax=Ilumatobacter nonamiensis TaxID=467093 RepID=UPI00034D391B|nr:hypothetical protein [Ilumatobacter nonamiensis]